MAKVVSPVICKIVAIGRPKESNYALGQFYHPVLFADTSYPEGHEDAKVWKNLSSDEVAQLQKGDTVQLVPVGKDKQGNDKHQIVKLTPAPSKEQQAIADHHTRTLQPAPGEWSESEKRAIAAKVTQNAKLFKFCLETATVEVGHLLTTEESLRSVATTLFIQALK